MAGVLTTFGIAAALAVLAAGCVRPVSVDEPDAAVGRKLFGSYCAACHGSEGEGGAAEGGENGAPPLSGAPWISGPDERLVRIVLHGLGGPVEVAGKVYELEMPGFGPVLSDEQVAAVLNRARAFSDEALPPVRTDTVRRVRERFADREGYWTAAELEARD